MSVHNIRINAPTSRMHYISLIKYSGNRSRMQDLVDPYPTIYGITPLQFSYSSKLPITFLSIHSSISILHSILDLFTVSLYLY